MRGCVRIILAVGLTAGIASAPGCRGRQTRSARSAPNDRVSLGPGSSRVPAPGPGPSMLVPGQSSAPLQSPGYGPGPSIPLAPPAQEFEGETTLLPPPPDSSLAAPRDSYFPQRKQRSSGYDFFPSEPNPPEDPQAESKKPGRWKRFWNTLTSPIRRTSGQRD